jgi:hypothetical protein
MYSNTLAEEYYHKASKKASVFFKKIKLFYILPIRLTNKHKTTPRAVGIQNAKKVHLKLLVSLKIVKSAVAQGK